MCLFKLFDDKYKKVYPDKICNATFVVIQEEQKEMYTKKNNL